MLTKPGRLEINLSTLLVLATLFGSTLASAQESVDNNNLEGLEWHLIGPWRGGRVTTVTGVPDNPMLYYMGATGDGVGKTENAGTTWENLSDEHFNVGTIGAVAVAHLISTCCT